MDTNRFYLTEMGFVSLILAVLSLVLKVFTPDQHKRLLAGGVAALSDEERCQLAVGLMKQYNKVTHIYELVKASGSTNQVIYDRDQKVWLRRENITAKHNLEVSVNPFNGAKSTGDIHAPLIYFQDPRSDVPDELQRHLLYSITGCDEVIVSGWMRESSLNTHEHHRIPTGSANPNHHKPDKP